jgi:hypothetical protein
MSTTTRHFVARVRERIGPDVDPYVLAETLLTGVDRHDPAVQFVARTFKDGRRVFRYVLEDSRPFYFLINTEERRCVTVLPPGFTLGRHGKSRLVLKEHDL